MNTCSHKNCTEPSSVACEYNPRDCFVLMRDFDPAKDRNSSIAAIYFCRTHSESFRIPENWKLQDARTTFKLEPDDENLRSSVVSTRSDESGETSAPVATADASSLPDTPLLGRAFSKSQKHKSVPWR